jgi:RluA family pseudouridine synthase
LKILETHIVPAIDEKIRLQEYAISIFNRITSRSGLKKAIKREEILLDGKPAQTSDWIEENQVIQLIEKKEISRKVFQLKLDVIFENEHFAVVLKPSGYPTSGNYFKTIENALEYNLKPSNLPGSLKFPRPVHRLDNPTSGLLIIAKTINAQTKLNLDFEEKNIQKSYAAIVYGSTPDEFLINTPIDEKQSFSRVNTLRRFQYKNENYSLVKVNPETGRTHQIRIHLSSQGFPIVGDREYGPRKDDPFTKKGLYLTATGLSFLHPITNQKLEFNQELPKKFKIILESIAL